MTSTRSWAVTAASGVGEPHVQACRSQVDLGLRLAGRGVDEVDDEVLDLLAETWAANS